jgi:1-acylglycerone phosphate reductase
VDDALKPKVSSFWRTWFGRPDWLYYGGMSRLVYLGSFLGEWVYDYGVWMRFRLYELEAIVKEDRIAEEKRSK